MNVKTSQQAALAATAFLGAVQAAHAQAVNETVARIKDKDEKVRIEAWQKAAAMGAPALRPLAALLTDDEIEVTRAAKRALWQIVRQSGRPGADAERKAVVQELLPLLEANQPSLIRREVLWMISEIAGDEAVAPVAAILSDAELRDDARMVLQRLPGDASLQALKQGLAAAPEPCKYNIAVSLRARGVNVKGYPSQKLTPTKQTNVRPVKTA